MRLLFVVLFFLQSYSAIAAEPASPKAQPVDVFGYSQLSEVVVGLVLVILLIFVCAWVVRKLNGAGLTKGGAMRVVATLPLGMKEKLILVQVGEQQILLGVAPGRVNTIQVFEKPIIDVAESAGGGDFSAKLREVLGQGLNR